MKPISILVDSFADQGLTNAQMINGREIIRRLAPERFQVSVFHVADPDPKIVARPNTRLVRLPQRRQTVRILEEFFMGSHRLLFYVKPSPAAKLYLTLRSRSKGRPVVVGSVESQSDLRNEPTINAVNIRMWEQTVLRSDVLFSNSQSVRQSLEREYHLSSEVIPTGVDTDVFRPPDDPAPRARTRVLFVGSLRPFKGPQVVVQAAARFPTADFVIVGDGTLQEELRQRVRAERLGNVTLTGPLGRSAVLEHYQQSDILLFPSRWEGSPRVILEAAACGLPVIARNDYQPETVVDGKTGFLAGCDEDLFSRLGQLLHHVELRRQMGDAGRRHIMRFDWEPITRQWEEAFLHLLSGTPPHGMR
jgi:glycosyltransferase involved in cell wall biosynthesis